jgi:hypothetical protein
MKLEMRKDLGEKHLWVLFGEGSNLDQAQIIVDLEHNDVRVVSAQRQRGTTYDTSVVKVMFSPTLQVERILRDDIFQHDMTANPIISKRALIAKIHAGLDEAFEGKMLDGTREKLKRAVEAAVDEVIGPAKQRELTGAEKADTERQVDGLLNNYDLSEETRTEKYASLNYSALRHDLLSMVNVAKGGFP